MVELDPGRYNIDEVEFALWDEVDCFAAEAISKEKAYADQLIQEIVQSKNTQVPVISKAPKAKADKEKMKFRCNTCSQVFDSKIALSIHTGRIHKHESRDKSYKCNVCNKGFLNSSYLAQHMRIHTGIKPYSCALCEKKFTQLSHLQQHKRTHSGEKPYKCPHDKCNKAFSQLSNLQSHSRSHLQDGNIHKCSSCYKCYFDEHSLIVHMRTHLETKRARNYNCDICGKSYTQDTYLQNHMAAKHDESSKSNQPVGKATRPTSIQAATRMTCKIEEYPKATGCSSQPHMMPKPGIVHGYPEPSPTPDTSRVYNRPMYHTDQNVYQDNITEQSYVRQSIGAKRLEEDQANSAFFRSMRAFASIPPSTATPDLTVHQLPYSYASYMNQQYDYHHDKMSMAANDDYLMGSGFRDSYQFD